MQRGTSAVQSLRLLLRLVPHTANPSITHTIERLSVLARSRGGAVQTVLSCQARRTKGGAQARYTAWAQASTSRALYEGPACTARPVLALGSDNPTPPCLRGKRQELSETVAGKRAMGWVAASIPVV